MPSYLRIAVFRGCAFFKIHRLKNSVLSVFLFDCKCSGLYLPFALQRCIFGFLFFLFGNVVGEEVKLDSTIVLLRGIDFWQDMICNDVHIRCAISKHMRTGMNGKQTSSVRQF